MSGHSDPGPNGIPYTMFKHCYAGPSDVHMADTTADPLPTVLSQEPFSIIILYDGSGLTAKGIQETEAHESGHRAKRAKTA